MESGISRKLDQDSISEIIYLMDMNSLVALYRTDKKMKAILDLKYVLNRLSLIHGLPMVDNFGDLSYYSSLKPEELFILAAGNGDRRVLDHIYGSHPDTLDASLLWDINGRKFPDYHFLPLMAAAKAGDLEVMKYLIKVFDIDLTDQFYIKSTYDIMNQAAEEGYTDIVAFTYDILGEIGLDTVEYAAEAGHLETVQYLLGKNPDPILLEPALVAAAREGHIKIFMILADRLRYDLALDVATQSGNPDLVMLLIDPNRIEDLNYALKTAAWIGQLEIIKLLIRLGADEIDQAIDQVEPGRDDIITFLKENSR